MNDLEIAERYLRKAQQSKDKGHIFDLSFSDFARIMRKKTCVYTGIEMTTKLAGKTIKDTDRTLERMDNSIGYTKSNTIAVCHYANKLKSHLENPGNEFTAQHISKMMKKVIENKKALDRLKPSA